MARPTGLGRGLNALLDPAGGEPTLVPLPIDQVQPNPRQPRRAFDQDALDDLARSITQDGIMQPIIVRSAPDGRYEIIAGERRWRAAQRAGLQRGGAAELRPAVGVGVGVLQDGEFAGEFEQRGE